MCPTWGLQVSSVVGVAVQEEVVARRLLGDPGGQVLQLRGGRAGQLDGLVPEVDLLLGVKTPFIRCTSVPLWIVLNPCC